MITFQRAHPLTSLGHFGAAGEDVKKLRATLAKIQSATGDSDFSPGSTTAGFADKALVLGAVYGAIKLGKEVPGMNIVWGKFTELLGEIPLVGPLLAFTAQNVTRGKLDFGWNLLDTDQQVRFQEWIERNAGDLNTGFSAALNFLVQPTTPTPTAPVFVKAMRTPSGELMPVAPTAVGFPAGAVAIRDPEKGVFRIVVKL
jgi:hypothetical protein